MIAGIIMCACSLAFDCSESFKETTGSLAVSNASVVEYVVYGFVGSGGA